MEIARELKKHPEQRVRMGVHSGPVKEVTDLSEQGNIAGAGINIAQRVMDCGDADHILVSKRVADDLEHYAQWRPLLHDLGTCEVKYGRTDSGHREAARRGHDSGRQRAQGRRQSARARAIDRILLTSTRIMVCACRISADSTKRSRKQSVACNSTHFFRALTCITGR